MRIYTVLGKLTNLVHGTSETSLLGYSVTPKEALSIKKSWLEDSTGTTICVKKSCSIVFGELDGVVERQVRWVC